MKLHHKAAAAILSAGLIFGSVGIISAESASAATSCSPQDQAVGSATARVAQAKLHVKKTKKHVKKAKKANKKHHTKASKKHLKKTKKLNRKAKATLKSRNAVLAAARAAAAKCHAVPATSPNTTPASSGTPVTPQQITNEITKVINGVGLPAADIQPLIDALTSALSSANDLDQAQLSDVLDQVTSLLGGGIDPSDLTDVLNQLTGALTGADLTGDQLTGLLDQVTSLLGGGVGPSTLTDAIDQLTGTLTAAGVPADQLLAPIEGLLSGLAGSGLSADTLNDIASQLTSSLTGAGLDDGAVSQVVAQVLDQLGLNTQPTDPTKLLSVVGDTVNTVVSDLGLDTAVTPSAITDLTNGLQGTLDQLSDNGGLLSGLAPITGGVLGLL